MSSFIAVHQLCHLHPTQSVTGFCAACLRQRLQSLDAAAAASLRRCSSSSLPSVAAGEARRRSCGDARYSLRSLFRQDEDAPRDPGVAGGRRGGRDLGFLGTDDGDEIRPVDPAVEVGNFAEIEERRHLGAKDFDLTRDRVDFDMESCSSSKLSRKPSVIGREIDERWQLGGNAREMRATKDHIDIELESSSSSQQQGQGKKLSAKDLRDFAGNFKSMLSKKFQNWRRKQKLDRQCKEASLPAEKPEKPSRRFQDAQSEVGLDALGRRSCDIDPSFSVEAGRMSLDGNRHSMDEPRASWDGYLFGGRTVLPRLNPMLSVIEKSDAASVKQLDSSIQIEDDNSTPGGSAQTREYYLHSSSRRRRSLDRSSSVREQPVEFNELRSNFNGKVTPAVEKEFLPSSRSGLFDRELRDWRSNSLKDDYFGSFESVVKDLSKDAGKKKSGLWSKSWNILGFLNRRDSNKEPVDRIDSDSWMTMRSRSYNCKDSRMNLNINEYSTKKRGEFVLERNQSSRYSPSHSDNGLLRFYLTPIRNSWRKGGGSGNSRRISSHYFTRTMLGLY